MGQRIAFRTLALVASLFAGCGHTEITMSPMQVHTAGQVGCPPDWVVIGEVQSNVILYESGDDEGTPGKGMGAALWWTATCNEREYGCTAQVQDTGTYFDEEKQITTPVLTGVTCVRIRRRSNAPPKAPPPPAAPLPAPQPSVGRFPKYEAATPEAAGAPPAAPDSGTAAPPE